MARWLINRNAANSFDLVRFPYPGKLNEAVATFPIQFGKEAEEICALLNARDNSPLAHILFESGDKDAPREIKDRNGKVVLALCCVCGRAEVQLVPGAACPGKRAPYEG